MLKKVFEIYKRLLSIHILTKTTDENGFHKDTEDAYEKSFDIFHSISELRQDLEMDTPEEVESVAQEAYDLVEELKGLLEKEVKSNKDIAMDELLRGAVLDISGLCGNLRKHLDKDVKELYKAAKE